MNMFNGMFGKVANGMCRLSMNGEVAVKTSDGYKTYNIKKNRLTNCNNFVFNSGKPKCVIAVNNDTIKVIDYEDSTVKDILPERHVFMGNTYFYGKIVSMFGNDLMKGKKGMGKMMSYMMMSEMMKGSNGGTMGDNGMASMLPFMLLGGGNRFTDIFDGMFDSDNNDEEVTEDKEAE